MSVLSDHGFAKVNLCLFLGGPRSDGRHELVTLFESVEFADEIAMSPSPTGSDEVICAGIAEPNLASSALAALRAGGWRAPPMRVQIRKRVPVAAGMGGGSADAAATLRLAAQVAAVPGPRLAKVARELGADVPGQLVPGPSLGTGAGEVVRPLPALADHALLVLPQPFGLSAAEVYREADRLGLGRGAAELAGLRSELEFALAGPGVMLGPRLLVNDLEPASLSLRPEIGAALEAALESGSESAIVCGSGPTVIGVFWGRDGYRRADAAAGELRGRFPHAVATRPLLRGRDETAAQRGPRIDDEPMSHSRK
jgi:4-diphosphocytidyl-2-C-methyl-D-erythritol kinase